ncbi:Reductase [Fulvivirga imtechensis AK7]|uniref:Reductase n=1 Tax=Fulvivirga imtechensis AK7 TaxID=1237149 RepID=L8JK96_9BACT|nr:SDR family oxidoreductase [Fulvivirga imtechensis]ELR68668.1 Reductase [Fulvivirga imtechensis AK7]
MNGSNKKIALVTGGSRGLGKDMALSLAQRGINVILTYNSKKEEALEVVREIEAIGQKAAALQLNVVDSSSFERFFGEVKASLKNVFGLETFDFLINNAGIGIHVPFTETAEEQFDTLMNIHLKAAFFLTQRALPLMNNGGTIVNVSTGLARFTFPGYAAYATMKGGIETLTRYQAKELGSRGIRANVIAPGAIETDFGGGAVRDNADLNAAIASQTALGRVGRATDIGSVVAFLCSDDAKWINGQRLEASGGMFL